mmetsp:Transcript_81402/g.230682  ORF Transcript_81402/g.230682 Transcript_81402/m.230682 type:complete len:279 (-) Transcript_81402:18-854(-)
MTGTIASRGSSSSSASPSSSEPSSPSASGGFMMQVSSLKKSMASLNSGSTSLKAACFSGSNFSAGMFAPMVLLMLISRRICWTRVRGLARRIFRITGFASSWAAGTPGRNPSKFVVSIALNGMLKSSLSRLTISGGSFSGSYWSCSATTSETTCVPSLSSMICALRSKELLLPSSIMFAISPLIVSLIFSSATPLAKIARRRSFHPGSRAAAEKPAPTNATQLPEFIASMSPCGTLSSDSFLKFLASLAARIDQCGCSSSVSSELHVMLQTRHAGRHP